MTALVSGTEIYDVEIAVTAVPQAQWRAICRDSAGAIDSVVELLQGKLSTSVMARLCRQGTGLFPTPREIRMSCSCPDSAAMCKHIAAVLYGIGVRLDHAPALLFTLRKVKPSELIERAVAPRRLKKAPDGTSGARRISDESSLGEIFGLDIARGAVENAVNRQSTIGNLQSQTHRQSANADGQWAIGNRSDGQSAIGNRPMGNRAIGNADGQWVIGNADGWAIGNRDNRALDCPIVNCTSGSIARLSRLSIGHFRLPISRRLSDCRLPIRIDCPIVDCPSALHIADVFAIADCSIIDCRFPAVSRA